MNYGLPTFYKETDLPPLLTMEEEAQLSHTIHHSDESEDKDRAVQKLVKSNLRLVMTIVKTYSSCVKSNGGVGLEDLINEGNMGLMIAAKRYDSSKSKFSTYASFWIRQSIIRSLCNQSRLIRLPTNLVQKSLHVFKYINEYKDKNNNEPSPEQISEALDMKLSIVERILCSNYSFIALDAPAVRGSGFENESARSTGDIIEDGATNSPLENTVLKDNVEVINSVLADLKEAGEIYHRTSLWFKQQGDKDA